MFDGIVVMFGGLVILALLMRWMFGVAGADVAHATVVDLIDGNTGRTPKEGDIVDTIFEVYEYDYNGEHYRTKSKQGSSSWHGIGEKVDIYVSRKNPSKTVYMPVPIIIIFLAVFSFIWIAVGIGVLIG